MYAIRTQPTPVNWQGIPSGIGRPKVECEHIHFVSATQFILVTGTIEWVDQQSRRGPSYEGVDAKASRTQFHWISIDEAYSIAHVSQIELPEPPLASREEFKTDQHDLQQRIKYEQEFKTDQHDLQQRIKYEQEFKTDQHDLQQRMKCNHQQRTESPRNGLTVHSAVNALPPRSPHSVPSGPHAPPLDFLIGSAPVPPPHQLMLPLPPDLSNARNHLLFAFQHQQQLQHQRNLLAAANPVMAAMILAQQFAVHQQQIGGTADGGKQMDGAVAAPIEAEHRQQRLREDGPEEQRQQQQQRN
uniref:Uncharacterized protein n=1 Tax=Globodera pallida TaxID=36090 RepID=A0A183CN31_GLOPA